MTSETPQPIRLADYKPTPYLIDTVHLDFNLGHDATDVTARLSLPSLCLTVSLRAMV